MFRLRGCSEDDTILFERTTVIFGSVVYFRSGVGAPGGFYLFSFISLNKRNDS